MQGVGLTTEDQPIETIFDGIVIRPLARQDLFADVPDLERQVCITPDGVSVSARLDAEVVVLTNESREIAPFVFGVLLLAPALDDAVLDHGSGRRRKRNRAVVLDGLDELFQWAAGSALGLEKPWLRDGVENRQFDQEASSREHIMLNKAAL